MDSQKKTLIIVGAGPTGLGAAYRLKESGHADNLNITILDTQPVAGGLSSTRVCDDGFSWDLGGHVVFSNYDYFNEVMEKMFGDELISYKRNAAVHMMVSTGEHKWIPFPIQRNLEYFPEEDQKKFEADKNAEKVPEVTFEGWMINNFGEHLTSQFMRPYNRKVWTVPADQMNVGWVRDRVATTTTTATKAAETNVKKWGPNSDYKYPKTGGTGAVWIKIADSLPKEWFRLSTTVEQIFPEERKLKLTTGEELTYDYLINTIPLPLLSKLANLCPETKGLRHSVTHVVGVGFKGPLPSFLEDKSWMYFPGLIPPFYRITPLSRYAGLAPENTFSLLCEAADQPHEVRDKDKIIDLTIKSICLLFNIDEKRVCSVFYEQLPYGYPIPSLERNDILKKVIPEFEKHSIYSRGRFGGYKYEVANQDHSFMQGIELIDYMFDKKECTIYKVD